MINVEKNDGLELSKIEAIENMNAQLDNNMDNKPSEKNGKKDDHLIEKISKKYLSFLPKIQSFVEILRNENSLLDEYLFADSKVDFDEDVFAKEKERNMKLVIKLISDFQELMNLHQISLISYDLKDKLLNLFVELIELNDRNQYLIGILVNVKENFFESGVQLLRRSKEQFLYKNLRENK